MMNFLAMGIRQSTRGDERRAPPPARSARLNSETAIKLKLGFALLSLLASGTLRAQDLEFSLNPGFTSRQRLQTMYLAQVSATGDLNVLGYPLDIRRGFALSARTTLNPHKYFSHEFFYSAMYGDLIAGDRSVVGSGALRIREAGYSVLLDFSKKNYLIRPFIAVGPTVTSYRYQALSLKKRGGDAFRFGLRNIGAIKSAFDAMGVAPLDGGTIFRAGLNYGAGFRIRCSRHLMLRADYHQTFAVDPDFFSKQSVDLTQQGITTSQDRGTHRRGVFTIGFSYVL